MGEAARAKVNDFELFSGRVNTKDVFRFQVAMDDIPLFEEYKSFEKLGSVRANLVFAEAHELILLQVLEQVSVEQFEDKALMVSET